MDQGSLSFPDGEMGLMTARQAGQSYLEGGAFIPGSGKSQPGFLGSPQYLLPLAFLACPQALLLALKLLSPMAPKDGV